QRPPLGPRRRRPSENGLRECVFVSRRLRSLQDRRSSHREMIAHRVRAENTAADSENKIHDDRVAAKYGFRGGLVPGVTVYGYMATAAIEHFGEKWLERGAMDVRFSAPVYEGEEVEIVDRREADGRLRIER